MIIDKVMGLPEKELGILNKLMEVWHETISANQEREKYYYMDNKLKDLGISVPPQLKNIKTVVGWPAKAVDCMASHSRFDRFVFANGENELMREIVRGNRFKMLYDEALTSELIHCCAFLTVSKGAKGEPKALINAYPATKAAGIYDDRKKRLSAGMTIIDSAVLERDKSLTPTHINLYTDTDVWEIKFAGKWTAKRYPHKMGRPMMEHMAYRPQLSRPFGKSRINGEVRSITDSAVREALRSEVTAEFFTAPQKYIMGADESIFKDSPMWEAYIGNIIALPFDEDGEKPTFGQLPQGTMQPHVEYKRSLAAAFAGATNIPVNELGIIHDNPSSAEAIYAAKEALVQDVEMLNEVNGNALIEVGKMALATAQNKPLSELTDEELSIDVKFCNPATPSIVSQADATIKYCSAFPWYADTTVALEQAGFTDEQIMRMSHERKTIEAAQAIQGMLANANTSVPTKQPHEDAERVIGESEGNLPEQG